MNSVSRTKNVTVNASLGIITQVIRIFIEFIIRTVFINVLGSEYLGVNGLFTNVLTILSFAELGIGNAIIFSMYKEIANNNVEKIKSLMQLYKKSYITIGSVVLIIGLLITPFIKLMINDTPNISESIYFIYILFLLNTSVSYFYAYKKAIISAHQKEYIINIYRLIVEVIKAVLQIVILILTKNFVLYLIIQIFCTLLDNLLASRKADKLYSYLKDKDVKKLDSEETKGIFSNVRSLVMYKFGSIVLNGTDNIIISKMLGLVTVGVVSNFNLLINTIVTLVGSILNGFTASIGNLNTNNDINKQENVFKQLFLLCVWIYGFCSIAFVILANDFVKLWVGELYQLPLLSIFAIVLHLYVNGIQFAGYTYRITMGLFNRGKYCPIIAAILNILLSILLCYKLGLAGIIFATSISRLVTTTWYDIYMVYRVKFKKSPLTFYLRYVLYFIFVLSIGFVSYELVSLIKYSGVFGFVLKTISCIIIPNALFLLIFFKTKEFKEIFKRFKELVWKKKSVI